MNYGELWEQAGDTFSQEPMALVDEAGEPIFDRRGPRYQQEAMKLEEEDSRDLGCGETTGPSLLPG